MSVTLTGPGLAYATADMILTARLSRDLNRSVIDTSDERLVNDGTASLLDGTLVYLHPTLESALAMDAIYRAGICTLSTDDALDGWQHIAVGVLRIDNTPTAAGRACRWTLTADVREIGT